MQREIVQIAAAFAQGGKMHGHSGDCVIEIFARSFPPRRLPPADQGEVPSTSPHIGGAWLKLAIALPELLLLHQMEQGLLIFSR